MKQRNTENIPAYCDGVYKGVCIAPIWISNLPICLYRPYQGRTVTHSFHKCMIAQLCLELKLLDCVICHIVCGDTAEYQRAGHSMNIMNDSNKAHLFQYLLTALQKHFRNAVAFGIFILTGSNRFIIKAENFSIRQTKQNGRMRRYHKL